MIKTTPFHERLSELNSQGLYTHWQGHLSALRYSDAPKHEYFAVRNSVGVFDTSPLFKYRIYGPDAEKLLAGVLVRDIRACRPGQAHYTVWCDDRGFAMEDGVVFRHSESDFLLTAARPNVGWFADHGRRLRVDIEDVSDDYGILAIQGPRSRAALAELAPEADSCRSSGTRRQRSPPPPSRSRAPATQVTSGSRSPSTPSTPPTFSTRCSMRGGVTACARSARRR